LPLETFLGFTILLAAALVGGMIAHRLKQPVILGYLVVGIIIGPKALGWISDLNMVETVATVGVSLLMFTLGLEISVSQFKQVGKVGLWGGLLQILATVVVGILAGFFLFQWSLPESILFGLIISLSSTAVCFKILTDRGEMDSFHGRIMIAILILQDISVVVMMLAIPFLSGNVDNIFLAAGLAVGKTAIFVAAAIVAGLWVLPWLMGKVGGVRTKELFLLTVLVLCLGAAAGTQFFGLSTVFGSFLVGLILRRTRFIHQALAEITPLRDIFATLFFVSLGMLFDPQFIYRHWPLLLAIVASIIVIKTLVVYGVLRGFGYNRRIAVLAGAGLFQIGEFGFILAQGGVAGGFAGADFYDLVIGSAIVTMLLTPVSMSLVSRLYNRFSKFSEGIVTNDSPPIADLSGLKNGVVIAGYGRIGQSVAYGLKSAGIPFAIVDIDPQQIAEARNCDCLCIYGDASNSHVLTQLNLKNARALVVAFPDPLSTVTTVRAAREINPGLRIIVRAHRGREAEQLKRLGVVDLVSPEYEASFRFLKKIFSFSGMEKLEREQILDKLRDDEHMPAFEHSEDK
jgi:monovalent cation:H+ antiporter-2, CPA2 family